MEIQAQPIIALKDEKAVAEFQPYKNNGGYCLTNLTKNYSTTVAVAGKNFCVIGADTRLSEGYSIHTRVASKIIQL